jgi:Cation transporter/ATPase, N-terminus
VTDEFGAFSYSYPLQPPAVAQPTLSPRFVLRVKNYAKPRAAWPSFSCHLLKTHQNFHFIFPITLFMSIDLSNLDWHHLSPEEALRRLGVVRETGLDRDAVEAQHSTARYDANRFSLPPSRMLLKVVSWVFGDFGSLLLAASIFFLIAWCASRLPPFPFPSSSRRVRGYRMVM